MPGEISISEIDAYSYLIKLMIYNDNRIVRSKMQKSANCLVKLKEKKEDKQ